jgi:Family of unknown function (DUF6074)
MKHDDAYPELPDFLKRRRPLEQRTPTADIEPRGSHAVTATVLPFPIVRRHGFVAKQVAQASRMDPDAGARYLRYQLKLQGGAMRRRGINEDLVQRELRCMASAIRTAQNVADKSDGEA